MYHWIKITVIFNDMSLPEGFLLFESECNNFYPNSRERACPKECTWMVKWEKIVVFWLHHRSPAANVSGPWGLLSTLGQQLEVEVFARRPMQTTRRKKTSWENDLLLAEREEMLPWEGYTVLIFYFFLTSSLPSPPRDRIMKIKEQKPHWKQSGEATRENSYIHTYYRTQQEGTLLSQQKEEKTPSCPVRAQPMGGRLP